MVKVKPKAQTSIYRGQHAGAVALLAASIAAVVAFAVFMIVGFGIERTVFWMLGLRILTFGGTYVGTFLGSGGIVDRSAAAQDPAAHRPAAG